MIPIAYYLLVLFVVFVLFRLRTGKALPLPPGPKGYPFIGNVYDIPHNHAWITYARWAKKYGEITHLNVFGNTTILLNSAKAATELLDKRSANYSDRPRMIMPELMGWEWDFAHMKYSDLWRRHRRVFHQYFQPRNLASQYPVQMQMATKLLEQLLDTPDNFAAHVRQYVGSAVLRAAYGYDVKSENDFYINLVQKAIQPLLHAVHAGNYLVEYLPFLGYIPAWFPGAKFKRDAKTWSKDAYAMRDIPFEVVKKSMAEGIAEQSFVSENLEKLRLQGATDPIEEEIVKNCAAMVYIAGSDTTASLLLSWMLALAHFPDVQGRAQAEVDGITGKSRLPDFNDRPTLPYLEAMLTETLRWAPVTPLALPHRTLYEDSYEGYRIPAGATITVNAWAILHDGETYPDPWKFQPERFMKMSGKESICPDPVSMGAFGFGRRICPGRYLATNSAWIAMSYILSAYTISKYADGDGHSIDPAADFKDGLVSHPEPFKIRITPRAENTRKIIETAKLEVSM